MRADELRTAQDMAKGIRGLAIVLPLLSVLLFALAVWLSEGQAAGGGADDRLVHLRDRRPDAVRPPHRRRSASSTASSRRRQIARRRTPPGRSPLRCSMTSRSRSWSTGWCSSPSHGLPDDTRPATFVRRALAPALREHRSAAYAMAGAVLLLIVLWGPTPATREVIPVLGLAVLFALGMRALACRPRRSSPTRRRAKPGRPCAAGGRRRAGVSAPARPSGRLRPAAPTAAAGRRSSGWPRCTSAAC